MIRVVALRTLTQAIQSMLKEREAKIALLDRLSEQEEKVKESGRRLEQELSEKRAELDELQRSAGLGLELTAEQILHKKNSRKAHEGQKNAVMYPGTPQPLEPQPA